MMAAKQSWCVADTTFLWKLKLDLGWLLNEKR